MTKSTSLIPVERIEGSILLIRGQKVMLDRDLARLYGVETRVMNQAIRRNIDRFPEDFMFRLTREEIMRISQFVISSVHPGVKTLKFSKSVMAFTEHGALLRDIRTEFRRVARRQASPVVLCEPYSLYPQNWLPGIRRTCWTNEKSPGCKD
jgi:hypothetical protein